jgi:pimeloyl-ACP methyl ester carboxylesterase
MASARAKRVRALVIAPLFAALIGCAVDEPPPGAAPSVLDRLWGDTIRSGDVLVLVPGTGSFDYLGDPIEKLASPVVDVRTHEVVRSDAVVFEQAIAAAHRAGFTDEQLEAGELTFLLWGAGFQRLEHFDYISYDHIRVRIDILGGTNSVASGLIEDNLLEYTAENANIDARDIYTRLQGWLAAHPSSRPRNAVMMSHSWGGAVAEYLALEQPTIAAELGPLADGDGTAAMPFTVAAGVPAFILGYPLLGPVVRDYERPWGKMYVYEHDRPDDPVHAMSFNGDFGGHHYNIVVGEELEFLGAYGISTMELSCHGAPGACPATSGN